MVVSAAHFDDEIVGHYLSTSESADVFFEQILNGFFDRKSDIGIGLTSTLLLQCKSTSPESQKDDYGFNKMGRNSAPTP